MKTLIFFRHAKSSWDLPIDDHERTLNERGCVAARIMGEFLSRIGEVPEAALVSSAVRARETFEIASEGGGWDLAHHVTGALYAASVADVLAALGDVPSGASSLLLVGHEPTWSEIIGGLIGRAQVRMPTACMARVDVVASGWEDVRPGRGELIWHIPPRLLADLASGLAMPSRPDRLG